MKTHLFQVCILKGITHHRTWIICAETIEQTCTIVDTGIKEDKPGYQNKRGSVYNKNFQDIKLKEFRISCDKMSFSDADFSNMCCLPRRKSSDSPLDKRRDSMLNRQLREWKKSEDKTIKLLLLGKVLFKMFYGAFYT